MGSVSDEINIRAPLMVSQIVRDESGLGLKEQRGNEVEINTLIARILHHRLNIIRESRKIPRSQVSYILAEFPPCFGIR